MSMSVWFWFWLVIAAALLVMEIFTAGFFMLPFAVGAAVAAVLDYVRVGVGWQWLAFIVVSTSTLLVLRRFAERITHEPPEKVGADRVLGKSGTVVEELDPHSPAGRVRVGAEEWRAESLGGTSLAVGTKVIVERIEGTRLIVAAADAGAPEATDAPAADAGPAGE